MKRHQCVFIVGGNGRRNANTLKKMFEHLARRANEHEAMALRCGYRALQVEIRAGEARELIHIGPEGIGVGPSGGETPDIVLRASTAAWREHQSEAPRPGFQALATMRRCGHLTVEGDLLAYHQNLLLLEMLLTPADRNRTPAQSPPRAPWIESITGRYLHLDIGGEAHRIYFEEAGEGIPLLCLHTAGADARQYRSVLNDADVTRHFRVIAFDLPLHGKSSPPHGYQERVYELTTDAYVNTVMGVTRALNLERPVVMGCSIGGRIVLHLALRHPEALRAVIGLQSAHHAIDTTGSREDATWRILHRPDAHGSEVAGALMNGVMAPQSPAAERWETMWHYMQGGPGVFIGDLHYYFQDGDLRNGATAGIDTSRCPVYLLSGEYDPSATPEMGRELAAEIGATHFEVMTEMGHFPMSENPARFREYLLPVLERIRNQG